MQWLRGLDFNIPDFRFHDCWQTFASRLAMDGVDP